MITTQKLPLLFIFVILLISGCSSKPFGKKTILPEYGNGDISIEVPKFIVVYKIDGKTVKLPRDRQYLLKVSPGQHTFTVSYLKDWKDPSVNELSTGGRRIKKIVHWNQIDLPFKLLENVDYRIRYEIPQNYKDAKTKVITTPIWIEELAAKSKTELVVNSNKDVADRNKDKPLLKENTQVSIVSLDKTPQEMPISVEKENQSLRANDKVKALNMLKHWWSEATEQEKKEFYLWIYP